MRRADRGIIQPGRYRVRRVNIAVGVLQDITPRPLKYTCETCLKTRSVLPRRQSCATGLNAYNSNIGFINKPVKDP